MPDVHSKIGASSAYRWLICPGSVQMSEGLANESSPYAVEGSCAHYLAEQAFATQPPMQPSLKWKSMVGKTLDKFPSVVITDGMLSAVDIYWEHAMDLYRRCGKHLAVEQKFELPWIHPALFGTCDLAGFDDQNKTLYVSDYKHGAGKVVDVVNNPQGMYYALGGLGPNNALKAKLVVITIIQPRAPHDDGPVRSWEVTPERLYHWAETVLTPGALATENPNAPLVAGGHCQFCPAAGMCPERAKESLAAAALDFSVVTTEGQKASPPAPDKLTIDQISRILNVSGDITAWLKAVHDYAESVANTGMRIPGWKLVAKRANRAWTEEAKDLLPILFGDDAFKPRELVGIPEAEKRFGKKSIAELWTKPETGTTLAPDTDRRPEVLPAAAEFMADADFLQ